MLVLLTASVAIVPLFLPIISFWGPNPLTGDPPWHPSLQVSEESQGSIQCIRATLQRINFKKDLFCLCFAMLTRISSPESTYQPIVHPCRTVSLVVSSSPGVGLNQLLYNESNKCFLFVRVDNKFSV